MEISADVKILSNVKFWVSALALDFIMVFRFLRGGSEAQVLLFQEDSLQNHNHFLTDPGHGHEYTDIHSTYGDLKAGHHSGDPVSDRDTSYNSNSKNGQTGILIEGVKDARTDSETRPKNMHVLFIMKVC